MAAEHPRRGPAARDGDNARVRILQVAPFYPPSPARGGMARAAGDLCAALAARGHEVTVFTADDGEAHPADEGGAVRVRRFPGPRWLAERLVPFGRGLGDAIATEARSFDVAHLHGHRSGMVRQAARALRRAGIPWVLQPHGTFPSHGQRVAAKAVWDAAGGMGPVAHAAALLALSEAEARDLPAPAIVIGSGVRRLAVETAPADKEGRLLFVGSDAPQKRLAALGPLLEALPGAGLDVVGPVGETALRALGPAPRVRAHGVLTGGVLAAAYRRAALVVHPAVGEAFGMAAFEAALLGTPAVVAGGHGCGEWFGRAGGCVVAPDDAPALADAVRARLCDPALGAAECRRVAAFAESELTWDRVAHRVEAVYDGARAIPRARAR